MMTLQELGTDVIQIREAIDDLTIKGSPNAAIVLFCNKKCNEIVSRINEAIKTAKPGDIEVNLVFEADCATEKEDDSNGNDSGVTGSD